MDCGGRGSVENDYKNAVDSRSGSLLEDGGGKFLSKNQGELDCRSLENKVSLLPTEEPKDGGGDDFLMERVEDAFEIMLPPQTSIMQPESIPSHLDEDKLSNDMAFCESQAEVVDSGVKKYKYKEDASSTEETAISCEVSTLLSCEVISDLRNETAELVACFKTVDNPRPTVPDCGLSAETTNLTSFPCSSLQENKVKSMMSINDEVSIVESDACNQISPASSTGMPLHLLCKRGLVSTNCENCKDEQCLRVLGSSKSMDENTGDMYIQSPPSGDCQGTLDKLDTSLLNNVGMCGAQTDDAVVHNLSTFRNTGKFEDISDVTTDVVGISVGVKSKNMFQTKLNICSSEEDCRDAILHCSDEKSISQTCMGLVIVRNGSSKSLDVKEQLEKSCLGPIGCSGAVGSTEQSIDAGNEIGGAFCIRENDCLTSLSSSLQRRYTTRKSSQNAQGPVSRKKTVKKACLHEPGEFFLKALRRKRSCPSKPARSSSWGFSADLIPSAQQIKSGDTGVQNQAVGPQESRKSVKESAKSQKGASKKGQVISGTLRFKFKVGKDVGQKILNTVAIEKVDVSTSADVLSHNHITGLKGIVSKLPKSGREPKRDVHKRRSDHQSKHEKDIVNEDSCPVACCVDPEFETKDVSTDLQEKSVDDVVSGVPGIQPVEVEASGGASDNRYLGPETSPDSEVINSVPDVMSRHQDLRSVVLTAPDSLECVRSSKNRNITKKDKKKSDGTSRARKSKSSKNRGGKKMSDSRFHSDEILHPSSISDLSGSPGGKVSPNVLSENTFREDIFHPPEKDTNLAAEEDVHLQSWEDGHESCSPNCLRSLDLKMSHPSKNKQHRLPKCSRPHSVNKGSSRVSDSALIGEAFACRERELQQMQENGLIADGDDQVEDNVLTKTTGSEIGSVDMPVLDPGFDRTSAQCALPDSAWVLCDDCHKWRRISVALANSMDEACSWTCKDNLDASFSDCSVPQEKSNEDINAELGISDVDEEGHNGELNFEVQAKQSGYRCRKAPESHFWHIDSNEFLQRRRKSQTIDEIMVCHCKPPPEGQLGCGDSCLNRMLNIECIQGTCPCGDLCSNQQFQKRSYANMEWARCGKKGFGLKMLEDISAGKFLIEYVGEVLDLQAYNARQKEYASKGQRHFYFMTLNANEIIDACVKGNLGRFINHSCDPNCRTEKWMVNGEICIGLFALREIKKGEELTFDYNYVRVFGAAAKKCHCGSAQCRGYIGGDPLSTEVIVQDDSDEEYPEPMMLKKGQDLESVTMTSSRLDLLNDKKLRCSETVTEGAKENEISDVVVGQKESPKQPESSIEGDDLRTNAQLPRQTASSNPEDLRIEFQVVSHVDTAKEEKAIDKLANSLAKPETSSSFNKLSSQEADADKVKVQIKGRRHAIPKSHPNMKTSSSIRAKKGKVYSVPPIVNKIPIVETKPPPFSTMSKKASETSSCGRSETVEEKLNELLDLDGGITKRKDATKIYLKLLFLTAASGDSGNGEAIQRNRELSMILDALLKTKSRAVLTDIINKNGLQMLHNIMKKYRKDFIKIPILRKLLKVLEYLAVREILTLGHIMASPPCRGMESFRESILSFTEHGDKQVHQIARSFRDRWIPRQYKKLNYIERDEGRSDCAKQERSTPSTPSPNLANGESCSTSSGGISGATATRTRKRKSRWDVPGEPDNEVKIASGAALKFGTSPLPEFVASAHHVNREADESFKSVVGISQPLEAISPEHGKQSTDDEDVPPGFSPLATSSISATSSAAVCQPSDVVMAHPQKRFNSRLPVSYGIPLESVQQFGSHAAESSTGWAVAPSMPFLPFPPLPPHPRNRKDLKDASSGPDSNDQASDDPPNSHTPASSCPRETPDPDTMLGKRTRQDSHALPRKYFRQQKRKGPPWPKDESTGMNEIGVGSANEKVLSNCFPNDSNCRVGKTQNGFHDHPSHRSHH